MKRLLDLARSGFENQVLVLSLALAFPAALIVSLAESRVYLHNDFPLTAFSVFVTRLDELLASAVVFTLLWVFGFSLCRLRISSQRLCSQIASGFALAPILLFWFYRVYLARGIYLSRLLSGKSLGISLGLAFQSFVIWAVVAIAVDIWIRRRPPGARASGRALAALILAATGLNAARVVINRQFPSERPHVLLIVVDALRPDHLGCYGYSRPTSPAIDSLAAEGIRFETVISQSTLTKTSIASLFTGLNPHRHGVYRGSRLVEGRRVSDKLDSDLTTLAEGLGEVGYLSAAFLQQSQLGAASGYAQGFMFYNESQRNIDNVHRRFLRWLSRVGSTAPVFAYLHYIDLHDPYRPDPPFDTLYGQSGPIYSKLDLDNWSTTLRQIREGELALTDADVRQLIALYDGKLTQIDRELERLWQRLEDKDIYEDALVILTSDHGDGFMEHGFISHSAQPYDELIRVPLILKFPEAAGRGMTIREQIRLVDVMPTVLDYVGSPTPKDLDGKSLWPVLQNRLAGGERSLEETHAVSEIEMSLRGVNRYLASIRTPTWKLMGEPGGALELYNLLEDPGEQDDRFTDRPAEAAHLEELLMRAAEAREEATSDQVPLEAETVDSLRALGYIE